MSLWVNDFPNYSKILYNYLKFYRQEILSSSLDGTIKTENIFRIISEITEALSLTNIPKRLLDTALDTLSRRLDIDCCWVQIITPNDNELSLSAYCGFTPYMQNRIATMDLNHPLGQEVIGIGNTIIVPDLSRNGHFDISLFEEAGFRSLIAVPIMTYRANGIMGIAYRDKKRFTKEYSDLLITIAGVIGMALNKCVILEQMNSTGKSQISDNTRLSPPPADKSNLQKPEQFESEAITSSEQLKKSLGHENSKAYEKHLGRMRVFRNSHKARDNK